MILTILYNSDPHRIVLGTATLQSYVSLCVGGGGGGCI